MLHYIKSVLNYFVTHCFVNTVIELFCYVQFNMQ